MKVTVSPGNTKLGAIPSVSLPAVETCPRDAPCYNTCYANKLMKLRKTVRDSYDRNLDCLRNTPRDYWRQVEGAIMMNRYFRFHVSGDIVDEDYFTHMIAVASRNPECEILCFTKKYDIVNNWLWGGHNIPGNLHIIFSVWRDYECYNPFDLPEAHVRYKDGFTTANIEQAKECGGNCTECAIVNGGCWTLRDGEQIVFNQH